MPRLDPNTLEPIEPTGAYTGAPPPGLGGISKGAGSGMDPKAMNALVMKALSSPTTEPTPAPPPDTRSKAEKAYEKYIAPVLTKGATGAVQAIEAENPSTSTLNVAVASAPSA